MNNASVKDNLDEKSQELYSQFSDRIAPSKVGLIGANELQRREKEMKNEIGSLKT